MIDSEISIKSKYELTNKNDFILNPNPSTNRIDTVLSLLNNWRKEAFL